MAKAVKPPAPDHLVMHLFAPGMTALHRAGLGGLACTLAAMERQHRNRLLRDDRLPGPVVDGRYPWGIADDAVTLQFGKPELAGPYLEKLFAFAFQTTDAGLIYLPGQHYERPSDAILADLQAGFTLTFLQHGRVRALAKEMTVASYEIGGEGTSSLSVEYKKCSSYKHQNGWKELVDSKGRIIEGVATVDGPISPGTVIRHVAFTAHTGAEDPPDRMLPLYFALVGCLSLPVNRGVAALVVPVVERLTDFVVDRPAMTPTTATDCQIAGAADAAFRAQIRVRANPRRDAEVKSRARSTVSANAVPACSTMTFTPTPWASQQKSRVATLAVPGWNDAVLDWYERAMTHLPPRIVARIERTTTGKGKSKQITGRPVAFRTDSVVRPLIAENLAVGRPWYAGFTALMVKTNPATDKPFRDAVRFEQRGLHAMVSDPNAWTNQDCERVIVQAVHEAIRQSLGRIREETDGKGGKLSQATKNRWERFREKLRLDLAGSKTQAHVRFALMDLFSRGGNNSVLRDGWMHVLPVVRDNWQLARDLGLLALCSYAGRGAADDADQPDTESPKE